MTIKSSVYTTASAPLWASLLACVSALCWSSSSYAETLQSSWVEGFNNKARLLAGQASQSQNSKDGIYAGIEIAMPSGWKTYWKAPGDAGGIPPEFDFSQSENLAQATVLYPAPHRLLDKAGASIGYKDGVIFPVRLIAKDAGKPIALKLKAAYGVCKDLCVPAEAEISLAVAPDVGSAPELSAALARVPREAADENRDPTLSKWKIEDRDGKPALVIDVQDPGGTGSDAFAVGPDGSYMPIAKKLAETGNTSTFAFDLTDGIELKDLKGKPVEITMVGAKGQSQTNIVLP